MPTIPLEFSAAQRTTPGNIDGGAASVLSTIANQMGQDSSGAFRQVAGVFQARAAAVRAEQDQQARLRVAELQNHLAEAELQAAGEYGNADEYTENVEERMRELFAQATQDLSPQQNQRVEAELRVLQSAASLSITKRELAKRTDSARASLMETERNALSVFANGTAIPQERELARVNYFGALDDAVDSGVYTGTEAELIKSNFLKVGGAAAAESLQAAEVGFFTDQLFNSGLSPTAQLAQIENLETDPDTKAKVRSALGDRIKTDVQLKRNAAMDYAGALGGRILANPLSFSEATINSDPRLDPQDRKTMVSLYQEARDKSAVPKDDNATLQDAIDLSASDPETFIKTNFLAEKKLTLKTRGTLRVWQDHLRQQGELPDDAKLTVKGVEIARGVAQTRGIGSKQPGLKVNFETAYATAYAQKAADGQEPKTKLEQAQLADEILTKMPQVNTLLGIDMLAPDSEVPFFRLNQEGLNRVIDEAPIEDWPQHIGDAAVMQLHRQKVNEGMTPERAWDEVDRLRTDERAMRAAARSVMYPAPRLDFIEDEEVEE